MLPPLCTLFDPGSKEAYLARVQLLSRPGRRHALSGILGGDALHEPAVLRVFGHHHLVAAAVGKDPIAGVQSEVHLALALIGTMAGEAVLRQDGPDVAVELHRLRIPVFTQAEFQRRDAQADQAEQQPVRFRCPVHFWKILSTSALRARNSKAGPSSPLTRMIHKFSTAA